MRPAAVQTHKTARTTQTTSDRRDDCPNVHQKIVASGADGQPEHQRAETARPSAGRLTSGRAKNQRESSRRIDAAQRHYGRCFARSLLAGLKILDIFEGTQQIQQLIIARRLLGKTSAELK